MPSEWLTCQKTFQSSHLDKWAGSWKITDRYLSQWLYLCLQRRPSWRWLLIQHGFSVTRALVISFPIQWNQRDNNSHLAPSLWWCFHGVYSCFIWPDLGSPFPQALQGLSEKDRLIAICSRTIMTFSACPHIGTWRLISGWFDLGSYKPSSPWGGN